MTSIRKYLITFILIALVYAWFFTFKVVQNPSTLNVIDASENISIFVQPESGSKPIAEIINSAKKEVLVGVYLLSDKIIISSLVDAKKRGVDVRVMLEEHPFGGAGLNDKAKIVLENGGVLFKWSNPKFSFTHEKIIIVDSKLAFILNQNLTTSSFTNNREFNVYDTNKEDVLQIRNIFIADWQRQSYVLHNSHVIVSPDNSRTVLKSLIEEAQLSIDIEIEVIGDDEMITLLSQKAKNATIRILAPPIARLGSNKPALVKLQKSGALTKTLSSPYLHSKLIIVDDKKAYVGSVNLSTNSIDKNREIGVLLSEKKSLEVLSGVFYKDWNNAKDY